MNAAPATRPPRRLATPELRPQMTPAQHRAQDATVAALRDAVELQELCKRAERYLAAHPDRIEGQPRERRCPCNVTLAECLCAIQRAR